jgi:hypothetical protein
VLLLICARVCFARTSRGQKAESTGGLLRGGQVRERDVVGKLYRGNAHEREGTGLESPLARTIHDVPSDYLEAVVVIVAAACLISAATGAGRDT